MVYGILLVGISYCILVATMIWYLGLVRNQRMAFNNITTPFISIVIAARNEESSITGLLECLSQQTYEAYEVIVVDDHSEDQTPRIVAEAAKRNTIIDYRLSDGHGKKAALSSGIAHAKGEIIVTTDADCTMSPAWLAAIKDHMTKPHINMVIGGVRLQQQTFFDHLQAIEFSSLIGSGMATATAGYPTMCNGANLAFRKSVFSNVGGYESDAHIPSGDDEFLMRKIAHQYPDSIGVMSDDGSMVTTGASANLRDFIFQRLRWAGKWKHNSSLHTKLLAIYIVLVQCASVVSTIMLFYPSPLRWVATGYLISRMLVEFVFLRLACRILNVRWHVGAFVVLQILYPFYVIAIGLLAQVLPYRWKGRVSAP